MPLPSLGVATTISSFVGVLSSRAELQPDELACTFLSSPRGDVQSLSYGELDLAARGLATQFVEAAKPSDRALLILPAGLEFVATLMGCFYAGVIAVPAYPPRREHPGRPNRDHAFLKSVLSDCDPKLILTTREVLDRWSPTHEILAGRQVYCVDELEFGELGEVPPTNEVDVAFLQYTSGSTQSPRGVRVGHAQLLENSRQIQRRFRHNENSRGVIWLPPQHDMGLIGGILQPIFAGFPVCLMAPQTFLMRPLAWLEAISEFEATTSGGPNFAYDLCVERVRDDELAGLDLSRWSVAFTGAEPVRAETLRRFAEKFAPCGFRRSAFLPCYGLAEATLIVSGGETATGCQSRFIGELPAANICPELVSCGPPVDGIEVVIVDPESCDRRLSGEEGEIWVRGPSVADGYWDAASEANEVFEGRLAERGENRFLRTGDLGLMRDGQLYVTGRLKDVLIVNGRKVAATDIEYVTGLSHSSVSANRCAAVSVGRNGFEQIIVLAEVDRAFLAIQRRSSTVAVRECEQEIVRAIRSALSEQLGLRVETIQLVLPMSLPKTASGKIQRYLCRERYLAGKLALVSEGEF